MSDPANRASKIAVLGCGGLGVPAAWTLALDGRYPLVLIDDDTVEISNLHRQVLYATAAVGQPKAPALAQALLQLVPGLQVEVRQGRLTPDNAADLLQGCDAVLEGTDDAVSKFAVNDWTIGAPPGLTRLASIAAAIGRRGQWMVVRSHGPCYRCLFEAPPPAESLATCQIAGVLGPAVGQVGALAARSLLRVLAGEPDGADGALMRLQIRGLLRTPVAAAGDCPCQSGGSQAPGAVAGVKRV